MQATVIDDITQDQFSRYLQQVSRDFGLNLPQQNQGSYAEYGVEIQWKYNPAGETVTLACIRKPFWVPESVIDQHIQAEIAKLRRPA